MSMRRWLREGGIGLVFGLIFLGALVGQAFAGHAEFNGQQVTGGLPAISLGKYLTSADFAADVTENWQSEYLQFLLFIYLTVWLTQRGSPESKEPGEAGGQSEEKQQLRSHAGPHSPGWARVGGWRTR